MATLTTRLFHVAITVLVFAVGWALIGQTPAAADGPKYPRLLPVEWQALLADHDIYFYSPVFETTAQSMFGPGTTARPNDFSINLAPVPLDLDFDHGRIVPYENDDFGIDASFGIEASIDVDADFGADLHFYDFGPGDLSVRQGANVWLVVPRKDRWEGGDIVTIQTYGAFHQPDLSLEFPDGKIDLTEHAKAELSGGITACVWDCKTFGGILPSLDFTADLPLIPPFNPDTGDLLGDLTPPYTIHRKERTTIPDLVGFATGVRGSYGLPNPRVGPTDQTHNY